MAKSKAASNPNGKPLVIVESPAKAKTLSRFLGDDYVVEASIGHVRDLPKGQKEMPPEFKKEEWSYLGINVNDDFTPVYIVPDQKKEQVKKLRTLVKDASELYLATDEDREGEAISWHLYELLKPRVPVHRMVFHEITETAIKNALKNLREIDQQLVQAQEARRIVDRLFGYDVSPLLWRKFGKPGLSAGRVQSVAVRLIVERERERMAFKKASYWDMSGLFAKNAGEQVTANLMRYGGKRLADSKDFDPATGELKDKNLLLLDKQASEELAAKLAKGSFKVQSVEEKPYSVKPTAPFTTSTLQQEANRKLGYSARRTMQIAQSLYENGHISYMRTDSTTLSQVALDAARSLVKEQYGAEYLPKEPRVYANKVKNAQEAHEAIRPTGDFPLPQTFKAQFTDEQYNLYELIWRRTVASQMNDSQGFRTMVTIAGESAEFQVSGKRISFPGFLRAYVEGSDDPEADLADGEKLLPQLAQGEALKCVETMPKEHTTQPPYRYNDATLTRTLEQLGIGRPSTYASIIETILSRDYASRKGNALVPTWTALAVVNLLEEHLPKLIDYSFTARMEDDLDAISRGETQPKEYLYDFYFGEGADAADGKRGLKEQVKSRIDEIDPKLASRIPVGTPAGASTIHVRIGRFGPYLEQGDGERRASVPADLPPDELTLERAVAILNQAEKAEEPLGNDPKTGKPIFVKNGRFGPFVQLGEAGGEDGEKPKYASLLKGMRPEDITFELALKLLSLPRELGKHPESGEPVLAANGRFGPYIKHGTDNRTLPPELSPIEVTLEQALALLAQPKAERRGFGKAAKEVLKQLGTSPVTGKTVELLKGRYGPYLADGETNASLPKESNPDELSFEDALKLLAARAAMGPAKKKKKKAAAKKPAAEQAEGESAGEAPAKPKKKAAKKTATAKASTKKKLAKKKTKKVVKSAP